MEILIGVIILCICLAWEKYQEHRANEYAEKVIRRYKE